MEMGRWLCLGQSCPALPPVDRADSWLEQCLLGPSRDSQAMKCGLKVDICPDINVFPLGESPVPSPFGSWKWLRAAVEDCCVY